MSTAAGELPQDTICHALERAVAEAPDRVFLDFSGARCTYAEVDRMATELAHGLLSLDVEMGRPVATVLDNTLEAVTVWLAINKIGAVSAPVNTAFKGAFLRNQLHDCSAQVVIAEDEYAERVVEIASELPHLRHLVARDNSPSGLKSLRLDEIRLAGRGPLPNVATPDQLAMLVYTSGTTGPSKGCMIPHNAACNMGWINRVYRGYSSDDVLWTPLPLFHLNAIGVTVLSAMIAQATAAISPRFSVTQFWPEIERSRATTVALLGSMANFIAEAPDTEASRRCYGQLNRITAAPFAPETIAKWRERFGVKNAGAGGYGMSEAASISGLLPGDPPAPPGSSGRGGIDFDLRIFDDGDNEVPTGQAGEIVARPRRPNIMFQGYWNKPEATVRAWKNLWFHTGDIGKLDEDGFLYFVDRKKDYIRRRGENISSLELELVFKEHPALLEVAVHAVLSPAGEDEVKVTAELKPDAQLTEEELCRWSIDRVPYFAVPLYIEFRESLPRSATGKVLKEQLRSEGKTAATWDREAAGLTFQRR